MLTFYPRQETARAVSHLAERVASSVTSDDQKHIRILDLCLGTGCMSLLLHHELSQRHPRLQLRVLGIDNSPKAIHLAKENLQRCVPVERRHDIDFELADILANNEAAVSNAETPPPSQLLRSQDQATFDILISNPPYISPSSYWSSQTSKSVRSYEPRAALLPLKSSPSTNDNSGDLFYPHILRTARDVEAKVVLMEVGDIGQARRVAALALGVGNVGDGAGEGNKAWERVEIWRDFPDEHKTHRNEEVDLDESQQQDVHVRGVGNGRCVVCWRE